MGHPTGLVRPINPPDVVNYITLLIWTRLVLDS
jgi:hypothetical protein